MVCALYYVSADGVFSVGLFRCPLYYHEDPCPDLSLAFFLFLSLWPPMIWCRYIRAWHLSQLAYFLGDDTLNSSICFIGYCHHSPMPHKAGA